MKLKGMTMPGYDVYEYLLVLSPHEELWNKILKVKQEFAEEYKSEDPLIFFLSLCLAK